MARPLRLEYEGAVYHATIRVIITILRAHPILALYFGPLFWPYHSCKEAMH